jgi:hypothetical protein
MRFPFLSFLLIFLSFFPLSSPAQQEEAKTEKQSIFDLIYRQDDSIGDLLVVFDMDSLFNAEVVEIPAKVAFNTQDGDQEVWELKLELRGAFRRRKCDLPPLKLNFVKSELKDRGLYKYDEIKLVTHCLEAEEARENILREWTVYQMYELLTDAAFRTQLVHVTYKDTRSSRSIENIGILIENIDQLRKRLDMKECKDCMGMTRENYVWEDLLRVALFQYMIGNTDWSGHLVKNLKTIGPTDENTGLIPVPYDFDFSAMVSPSYALPREQLGQNQLEDRVYLGSPEKAKDCRRVFDLFLEKREGFEEIIESTEGLSDSTKKDMLKYLKSFYRELEKGKLEKIIAEAPPLETRF